MSVTLLPGLAADDGPSMRRYVRELSSGLQAHLGDNSVRVHHAPDRQQLSRLLDRPSVHRLDRAWNRYVSYPASLRTCRSDVFHILDQAYAHLIRGLPSERTVITCHDLIPLLAADGTIPVSISPVVARTFRWRAKQLLRAARIIAVSQATKATIQRYLPIDAEKVTVIHQGLAPVFKHIPQGKPSARGRLGVSRDAKVVLQVATRGPYKNTPAALHAIAQMKLRGHDDLAFVRVGSPLTSDDSKLAARLGIADAVTDAGYVEESTLVDWYNAADCLVFPSSWEGFGWPPLEAMACGTPVVASDIPAVAEITGDAALLFPTGDVTALALALERVLGDAALAAELREKGLRHVRLFTWARTAVATAAVYRDILQ